MKQYVCHKCRQLVKESEVIIEYRDIAGFTVGDVRAWCKDCYSK